MSSSSSKNWNDRADRDLFFTILSVKNIGVISGSEWTTIGNQMRSMGYGFTNEGCRQHFQGLRRAQNKADANGTSGSDISRKVDPTLNPITRRPGPGRGRPKKQQTQDETDGEFSVMLGDDEPGDVPPPDALPIEGQVLQAQGQQISILGQHLGPQGQPALHPALRAQPLPPRVSHMPPQAHHISTHEHRIAPEPPKFDEPESDHIAVDPRLEDPDQRVVKRPRIDESEHQSDQSLDDEAMLTALAAHTVPPDHYATNYNYGEA